MKKTGFLLCCLLILILVSSNMYSEKTVPLNLEKVLEIGRDNLMFFSITSVYEERDGNIYLLDRLACKVCKFSPDGKLLLTFGSKGQGPGDFERPHDIYVTDTGRIIVCEDSSFVSFFDKSGKFTKRLNVQKGLALSYMNDDLYYGWVWGKENREQILIDSQGNKRASFFSVAMDVSSISFPDESGRLVMFTYTEKEYTPFLLFSRYRDRSAIGVGNHYEILILDKKGKVVSRINRDIKPQRINSREKKYFIKKLGEMENWSRQVIKKFEKKIPKVKTYFDKILISEKHVYVFRIKNDATDEDSPFPIDVFSFEGEFLGTSQIPTKPVLISDTFMYVSLNSDIILARNRLGFGIPELLAV